MPLLLDTHVWLWSQLAPSSLGRKTTALLLDPAESVHVSAISTLELARLVSLGRVRLRMPIGQWVQASLEALVATPTDVTHPIAEEAYGLPGEIHRDPADRILIATARAAGLTLVTADERILAYRHVQRHDARR